MPERSINTNIGFLQGGGSAQLGSRAGTPVTFPYTGLISSWGVNNRDYIGWFDDFQGDTVNTTYQPTLSASVTFASNAQVNGVARATTTTTDDDFADIALGLHYRVAPQGLWFEARIASVTAITLRAIEVGVSDVLAPAGGLAFSNHSATPTAVATNVAMFGYDTDSSMTTWALNTVNNAGTAASTVITAAPTITFQTLGIYITPTGTAQFYVNNALVGSVANAVLTTANLTPWIALKSLSAAAKSLDVDYVSIVAGRV